MTTELTRHYFIRNHDDSPVRAANRPEQHG